MKLGIFTSQHVVTAKHCTKKRDASAKLLFCQSKPIAFLPFSLTSPSSLLLSNQHGDRSQNLTYKVKYNEKSKNYCKADTTWAIFRLARPAFIVWVVTYKVHLRWEIFSFSQWHRRVERKNRSTPKRVDKPVILALQVLLRSYELFHLDNSN